MAIGYREDFVSAQYLLKELMEFNKILHSPQPHLGLDYYASVFTNLQQGYGPKILSEFRFRSISCEQIDGI